MGQPPRRMRVAAYAVIVRDGRILLSRLAPSISADELWTLPGGGVEHGEDPRDAVVREVAEETGLAACVSDRARVYSAHLPRTRRAGEIVDHHALRIVYDGWVAPDAPEPRVVEVDGSTAAAAWHRVEDVVSGRVPTVALVNEALGDHEPVRHQRVGAYALIRRAGDVLLTRYSATGFHTGRWGLPGGGLDHGESPRDAVRREVAEECGVDCEVGDLLAVDDDHFSGTAPSGVWEDFHSVALVFAATVPDGVAPRVTETGGTTDVAAWVPVSDVESGRVDVVELVRVALASG